MPCIPRDWRTRHQRYRLAATQCEVCGAIVFPPRPVCSACALSGRVGLHHDNTGMPVFVVACPAEAAGVPDQAAGGVPPMPDTLPGGALTVLSEQSGEAGEGEQTIRSYD